MTSPSPSTVSALLFGLTLATALTCHATEGVPRATSAIVASATADATTAVPATASPARRKARRPLTEGDYIGKWIGVEGTLLDVARGTNGKLVVVNFWSLDQPDRGSFDAKVVPEGLRWVRNGQPVVARPSNGAATGLKWLDGKKDCLTVVKGEGYCRD